LADHFGLLFDAAVVVDDTETSVQGHVDSHAGFCGKRGAVV
jgi:hypothetical protein